MAESSGHKGGVRKWRVNMGGDARRHKKKRVAERREGDEGTRDIVHISTRLGGKTRRKKDLWEGKKDRKEKDAK